MPTEMDKRKITRADIRIEYNKTPSSLIATAYHGDRYIHSVVHIRDCYTGKPDRFVGPTGLEIDIQRYINNYNKQIDEFEKNLKEEIKMSEYLDQAKEFLQKANATMEIKFLGLDCPKHWPGETKMRNHYYFTIKTPRGNYSSQFWDSLYNTEISELTFDDWLLKTHKIYADDCSFIQKNNWMKKFKEAKLECIPNEYDILACLEKYEFGSFNDFCDEFGYSNDSISALKTYLACQEQYDGLVKIFTQEQMEELREIN